MDLMTSVPDIFAAGNILRGADMHDLCALEGRLAARNILRRMDSAGTESTPWFPVKAVPPIRYVVPQILSPKRIRRGYLCKLSPWPAMQLESTLKNVVMEAVSGKERIWEGSFHKLIANSRYPLPVEKFKWNRADPAGGIILRITSAAY